MMLEYLFKKLPKFGKVNFWTAIKYTNADFFVSVILGISLVQAES